MRDLDAFVAALDLDVSRVGICWACLSFVSFPLDAGDVRGARRAARRMTPILWDEGLAEHALAVVRQACHEGVAESEEALADLERNGAQRPVARAVVLRLAADLTRRTRIEMQLGSMARERLDLAPPELN